MERVTQVRQTDYDDDQVVADERTPVATDRAPRSVVAARIVWLITGIIMGLLALRFLLSLFGANRNNVFADLIYTLSYPFAAPFFGLFGYDVQYGRSRFEFETLIAIAVYALLGWLIARIVTVRSRSQY